MSKLKLGYLTEWNTSLIISQIIVRDYIQRKVGYINDSSVSLWENVSGSGSGRSLEETILKVVCWKHYLVASIWSSKYREVYWGPCQTSGMKFFAEIVNS